MPNMLIPPSMCRDLTFAQRLTHCDIRAVILAVQDLVEHCAVSTGEPDVEIVKNNGYVADVLSPVCKRIGLQTQAARRQFQSRINSSSWYCGGLSPDGQRGSHFFELRDTFGGGITTDGIGVLLPMPLAISTWGAVNDSRLVAIPDTQIFGARSRYGIHAIMRVHWWKHLADLQVRQVVYGHMGMEPAVKFRGSDVVDVIVKPSDLAFLFGNWDRDRPASVLKQTVIDRAVEDLNRVGILAKCDIVERTNADKMFRLQFRLEGKPPLTKLQVLSDDDATQTVHVRPVLEFSSIESVVDALISGILDRDRAIEALHLLKKYRGRPKSIIRIGEPIKKSSKKQQLSIELQVDNDSLEFS